MVYCLYYNNLDKKTTKTNMRHLPKYFFTRPLGLIKKSLSTIKEEGLIYFLKTATSFVFRKIFEVNIRIPNRQEEAFSIDAIVDYLDRYEVVSFDVFDTLITRRVYSPSDVFKLVEKKLKSKYNLEIDFVNIRKKAEEISKSKKNEFSNIDDIYEEIFLISNVSKEILKKIKQIEIDTEIDVCVPRVDILKIFNQIKDKGKKIILVSDMYLTSSIINKILKNSGYSGYSDLWISCEKGLRKDNGRLWDLFFEEFTVKKTIHVGDDLIADIKNVEKRGGAVFHIANPVSLFKSSRFYRKFKKYEKGGIGNSIMLGMFINCGIYNSPFAGRNKNYIKNCKDLGFIATGPLLSVFIKSIYDSFYIKRPKLLFLSREGYLLQKAFNIYIEKIEKDKMESIYFLSSRRAVSVPAIEDSKDILEIIKQNYKGGLINLIKERLGVDLSTKILDLNISMPDNLDYVMKIIDPYVNDILINAQKEKESLVKYVKNITNMNTDNLIMIDVGYSGTIQYYLSKVLKKKIGGYYLCTTVEKKPEKLACEINALFDLNSKEMVNTSKIFKGSLFLESILRAPYGQLIRFNEENGQIIPNFNDDKDVPFGVTEIQEGIIKYCTDNAGVIKDFYGTVEFDKNLAEDIFDEVFYHMILSESIIKSLSVQDLYSSNGVLKFNSINKRWSV